MLALSLNIGDEVCCKLTLENVFYRNKSYEICNIRYGTHADGSRMALIDIITENGGLCTFYEGNHRIEAGFGNGGGLFNDYFFTLRLKRKFKLRKIYEHF